MRDPEEIGRNLFGQRTAGWEVWTILLAGCLARLYRLGADSIWYDEGVSLYLAGRPVAELLRHTAADIHPPLYYLLLHFWTRLAGTSEFAAAYFSLAFGVVLIALVFAMGTRLFDRSVGRAAAAAVALSPLNVWYSQEVRMYTLGACLGLLAFWGAWRCVGFESGHKGWTCALYAAAATAGLYTLYYFAFLLVALNVWAAWSWFRMRKGVLRWWVAAQAVVLVLYLPWLPVAVRQALNPPVPPWRSSTALGRMALDSWSALSYGQSVEPSRALAALALAGLLFGLGLWARRELAEQKRALAIYLLGPLALIALVSVWTPLFHPRYVFTYSPAFYLVIAAGAVWLLRRFPAIGWLTVAVWLAVSGYSMREYHVNPQYAADDFRGAVAYLADHVAPGDALLVNAGYAYAPFVYYYPDDVAWRGRLIDYPPDAVEGPGLVVAQTGSIGGSSALGWGRPDADFYATDELATLAALERVFAAHRRIWVLRVYDTVTDPQGVIRRWLAEYGRQYEDLVFPGESYIRVQGYLSDPQPVFEAPPVLAGAQAEFGGRLDLLGYDGPDESLPGKIWQADFYWRAVSPIAEDYRVLLQLTDADGRAWARLDDLPLGRAYPTSRWQPPEVLRQPVKLRLPSGIEPGTYTLTVLVYDSSRGEAVGEAVAIGQLSVADPAPSGGQHDGR